eukprot:221160-Prymnesium_polylepis.1
MRSRSEPHRFHGHGAGFKVRRRARACVPRPSRRPDRTPVLSCLDRRGHRWPGAVRSETDSDTGVRGGHHHQPRPHPAGSGHGRRCGSECTQWLTVTRPISGLALGLAVARRAPRSPTPLSRARAGWRNQINPPTGATS